MGSTSIQPLKQLAAGSYHFDKSSNVLYLSEEDYLLTTREQILEQLPEQVKPLVLQELSYPQASSRLDRWVSLKCTNAIKRINHWIFTTKHI